MKKESEKKKLKNQAKEIMKIAKESGVQSNYFFSTTFNRYQVQLDILDRLEETLTSEGILVEKEYVKNRKNLYSNPAIAEYNKTTDSANKTVACLMKIIKNYNVEDPDKDEDPLLAAINGSDDNE